MSTSNTRLMGRIRVRDTCLHVDMVGDGYPILLMHGGPGADHWTLRPFRDLAKRFTLVFYDHRCNGRSLGAPLESMSFENLTADAEALRERLGFPRWAVLGHSFGGHVAMEYALRYPGSVSHLVLVDTGGDSRLARSGSGDVLARRGYSPRQVRLVRRWFTGEFAPWQMPWILMRIGGAYYAQPSFSLILRELLRGGWRSKLRPRSLIFAGRHLLKDWTVMDRLGGISAPTLIIAGRDDFLFPPEHQRDLAARIPHAQLLLIDHAGHNPHVEKPDQVMRAVQGFLETGSDEVPADRE